MNHLKEMHLRVRRVIKIMCLLFVILPSCSNAQEEDICKNDDRAILKVLYNNEIKEKDIRISLNNDNTYVINIIQKLKEIERTQIKSKIDSLKISLNILENNFLEYHKKKGGITVKSDNSEFESIFSINEYDFLLSQEHTGFWDQEIIFNLEPKEVRQDSSLNKIFYSKPIYTKNMKWALVFRYKATSSYIIVLKKKNKIWREYKTIDNYLISPKVKFKSTKN